MTGPHRVVLVNMPMGLAQVPNLGLSLLTAQLSRAGIPCTVRYTSLELLDRFIVGDDVLARYVELVEQQRLACVGAASFAARLFGEDPVRDQLVDAHLARSDDSERDLLAQIDAVVDPFIEHCVASEDWDSVAIVGFTDLFAGMTVPSALLARELKRRFGHLVTILGGWNTGGPMGEVIAERLPAFDLVLRGEADEAFVALCRRLLDGEDVDGIPGLVRRDPVTGELHTWPQRLVHRMDELPFPDFSDYFATLAATRFAKPARPCLPFETARGCWWGAVQHCRFCGLNGLSMPFRSKSPERALAEIDHLVERYSPRLLFAADTVLDRDYFRRLLPQLRDRHPDVEVAYELKAPVKREEVRALGAARIDQVTVGIESLSTRLLGEMQKGSTYLHNVHCLRLGEEFGVKVGWQHLYGVPGERLEDYEWAVAEMPWLVHLEPPGQACPIVLARFSPYYEDAARLGIAQIRAHPHYRLSYDWPQEDLDRVAYHFVFEHADGRSRELLAQIEAVLGPGVDAWRARHAQARLDLFRGTTLSLVVDTRMTEPRIFVLSGTARRVYDLLDTPTTVAAVERGLDELGASSAELLAELTGWLDADDTALLHLANAEAKRLATRPLHLREALSAEDLGSDTGGRARCVLAMLNDSGLSRCEGARHLALAVPRAMTTTARAQPAPAVVEVAAT